ncbi:hypothetical protein Tco_1101548 [Tanacetum coccineum]
MTPELQRQFENSSPYEMLQELKSMFEKQAGVEQFDLIQTFHACKQEEGKTIVHIVGLILNGLTSDFAGFLRNYNKHNMVMAIDELHYLLIEYEKGLPKKVATPQEMAIQGGIIQKANKKSLNAKGKGKGKGKRKDKSNICKPKNPKPSAKGHPIKDDTCHHYKEVGHYKRNCHAYLAELIKKKKQVGTTSSSYIFVMAAPVITISSYSSDESVGSPPSRVILFGDIPTVIPSTSVVAPETSTTATVISSAAPVVETAIVASPTGLCGLVPYSDSDSDSPNEMDSPEYITTLPVTSPFLCIDSSEASDSSDGPSSQDPYVATVARWRSRVTTRSSTSSDFVNIRFTSL